MNQFEFICLRWRLWHYSAFIDPTDLLFIPSWSFRSVSIRLFKHINQFPLMPVSPLENEPSVYCVPKLVGRQACGEQRESCQNFVNALIRLVLLLIKVKFAIQLKRIFIIIPSLPFFTERSRQLSITFFYLIKNQGLDWTF